MKFSGNITTIGRHLAVIAAYYLYEIGMLYAYTGKGVYFWDALIHLVVNLCLFYFHAHLVLDYSERRAGRLASAGSAIVLILLEFLVFLLVKYLLNMLFARLGIPTTRPYAGWEPFLRDVIWRFIYLMGLSSAYWFALSSMRKQRRLSELEVIRLRELAQQELTKSELLATENAFLKSQISSHFLFNTLNYLYSSVHDLKSEVGETILHLAAILRYSLNTPVSGKVSLAEELSHVANIFRISELKSAKPLQIDFRVTGAPASLQIIPLVLITLAENMLKYADFFDPQEPARFHCRISAAQLKITLSNKKRRSASPLSSGIGIENIKKRLNLAYQDKYTLNIIDSAPRYQLELIISLEDEDAIHHHHRRR